MPNSDWWVAELDAPQQLFALEFVVADPDTGVVDNNQCVHVLSFCILLVVYHRMLTSARRHLKQREPAKLLMCGRHSAAHGGCRNIRLQSDNACLTTLLLWSRQRNSTLALERACCEGRNIPI